MSSGLYSHTTRGVGTVLTAAIYNSDHTNHITNSQPAMIGGFGDNVAQMQLNTTPGALGSEILPTSLAEELQMLRYLVKSITGKAQWYMAPASSLEAMSGLIFGPDLVAIEALTAIGVARKTSNAPPTWIIDEGLVNLSLIKDLGGGVLTTGFIGEIRVPFACTITSISMFGTPSGGAKVDIWKDTYANYPPTIVDTIVSNAPPEIIGATKYESSVLTGWNKNIAAGDILRFNLDTVTNITKLSIFLTVKRFI